MKYEWEDKISKELLDDIDEMLPDGLSLMGIAVAETQQCEAALIQTQPQYYEGLALMDVCADVCGDAERHYMGAMKKSRAYYERIAANQVLDETSARAEVGEIGNQIHNISCEMHGDDALRERLAELASRAWKAAQGLSVEPAGAPHDGRE